MFKKTGVLLQYCLPKQWITELAGLFARWRGGVVTRWAISKFIQRYQVDMSEAADSNPAAYTCFNDFFGRPLRKGVRPLAPADVVCPADGKLSQAGPIQDGRIIQAKRHDYTLQALLGDDAELSAVLHGGVFATIYLSPSDYHRVHMPCTGTLKKMSHVPGALFSVNPTTAEYIPALFARNERLVCEFETTHGPLVMVLVGATIVGSMSTVWHGVVNSERPASIRTWYYKADEVKLEKGAEMGRFLLGSTVIVVFPPQTVTLDQAWLQQPALRMGEAMGRFDLSQSPAG